MSVTIKQLTSAKSPSNQKQIEETGACNKSPKDLAEIPALQISDSTTNKAKIEAIVKNFIGRGQSRPRKVQTLANTINTLFTKKLDAPDLMLLVEELKQRNYVLIKDGNVSYKLPDSL